MLITHKCPVRDELYDFTNKQKCTAHQMHPAANRHPNLEQPVKQHHASEKETPNVKSNHEEVTFYD